MKGGKRPDAGRPPATDPRSATLKIRLTQAEHARVMALGGSKWVRAQLLGAWLPIATAPRDGTWVLLFGGTCNDDEGDNDNRPVSGQWTNDLNGTTGPYGRWQFAWYEGGYYGAYKEPTHWQPLPTPPQSA